MTGMETNTNREATITKGITKDDSPKTKKCVY